MGPASRSNRSRAAAFASSESCPIRIVRPAHIVLCECNRRWRLNHLPRLIVDEVDGRPERLVADDEVIERRLKNRGVQISREAECRRAMVGRPLRDSSSGEATQTPASARAEPVRPIAGRESKTCEQPSDSGAPGGAIESADRARMQLAHP